MSVEQLSVESESGLSTRRPAWRKLLRDPQALVTMSILAIIVLLGVLSPVISPFDPDRADLAVANAAPGSEGHLLGTDQSGRDIVSRLLASIGTSLISGLIGASIAVTIGVVFGLIGGYFGRRIGGLTEWIFNLVMTFPGVLVLVLLMPVTKGDFRFTMLVFGVLLSPNIFRIVRNQVIGVKNELYVDAARVSGLSNVRILGRHVLSVIRGPIIISAAFMFSACIGVQSGLAFLGIGSTQTPSFGAMVSDGFTNLYRTPLQFIWPSLALGILTASLVLLGNALRDTLEGSRPTVAKLEQRTLRGAEGRTAAGGTAGALLTVSDLVIAYPRPDGELKEVVQGVSFQLDAGEVLGVVGESGSGKTQTAFAVLGVLPPEAVIVRGSIVLDGVEIVGRHEKELEAIRGRTVAYIPQEPMSNLDPSYTVGAQLVEALRSSTSLTRREARERVLALLERVGIVDPKRTFSSYPHQISGGMAQRVLIAGAVASRPKVLIADEPTTALDVTVQAEILDLLRDLQEELGMAVLLVTHNFGVVADVCERIAVMNQGRVVESGESLDVFRAPQHPYTRMLLDSILDEETSRDDEPSGSVARGGKP